MKMCHKSTSFEEDNAVLKNLLQRQVAVAKARQSEIMKQDERIAELEAALYLACHRTITPCPALPCSECTGYYAIGTENEGEACTRGKIDFFIRKARES